VFSFAEKNIILDNSVKIQVQYSWKKVRHLHITVVCVATE